MSEKPKYDLEVDLSVPEGMSDATDPRYRILVVADFCGPGGKAAGPLAERVTDVTPETFDGLLTETSPGVDFTLADPVTPGGRMVGIELRFDSLRAFDPRNLVQMIPAASTLMRVRAGMVDRLQGRITSSELSRVIAEAAATDAGVAWLVEAMKTPAVTPSETAKVDSVLDQLDLGDESPTINAKSARAEARGSGSDVSSLVSAAAGPNEAISAGEAGALRKAITETDRRISAWLTAVLHAPRIQQLEASWRGLAWLTTNLDYRNGIRLSVLHAGRDDLVQRLTSRVIDPVFDAGAEAPDLIIVDGTFGMTAPDLQALDELAQHAASLPAVVIAGLSTSFFGVKNTWQIPTLPPLVNLLDQWQYAKWKSLRVQPYARNLGLVFGRLLLREPFGGEPPAKYDPGLPGAGADSGTSLDFHYQEPCATDKDLLWSSGALAVAYTAARSFADTGWPSGMAGQVHGRIENLPRFQVDAKANKWLGPTDAPIPQSRVDEMGMSGINVAVGVPDRTDAILWNGLTVAKPKRSDASTLLEVSLPYQLFAQRLSTMLLALKPRLTGQSPDQITSTVRTHVEDWLRMPNTTAPLQLVVQTKPVEGRPDTLQLAVTVTPPSTILPGGIPIVMGYTVP